MFLVDLFSLIAYRLPRLWYMEFDTLFAREDMKSVAENRMERKVLIDRAEITDRWGEKGELKGGI